MGKEFLGRGWSFPVQLDANGRLLYHEQENKIQESILVILGTARGERVMRPDFGSRLHELVFAPVSSSTKSLIGHYATEALVNWEPRIDVLSIDVRDGQASSGVLFVDINYRVRATNSRFNLVYPFYLREGNTNAAAAQAR
jgi:phage baseplate assembly protein W